MKSLTAISPPDNWNVKNNDVKKRILGWYSEFDNNATKIKPKWSEQKYSKGLKSQLLEMTDNECAYCGRKINRKGDTDTEHYLPKNSNAFPYLAYDWNNFLPACKNCNRYEKHEFVVAELTDFLRERKIKIIDSILEKKSANDLYLTKEDFFGNSEINARLVHPVFDNPNEHLIFEPSSSTYKSNTEIGESTIKCLFLDNKEFASDVLNLSNGIKIQVKANLSLESIIEILVPSVGYSFIIEKLYSYWTIVLR